MFLCLLCPHGCRLSPGETGLCGVRRASEHGLETRTYNRPVALALDPIEKKPLFHFLPGSPTFSYATYGCNLRCSFCQNHDISHPAPDDPPRDVATVPAPELVEMARSRGADIIAHTYTEPTVYLEYSLDIATLAAAQGMKNVFVTNGFMAPGILREVIPVLHGANVDLKSFSDETYRSVCGGRLKPVLHAIESLKSGGVWVEVTTLVVPGMNDSRDELKEMAGYLVSLDPQIPWHVSRFSPNFRMTHSSVTPAEVLLQAVALGRDAGLKHVYAGNLGGEGKHTSTVCPSCGEVVLKRCGFQLAGCHVEKGCCRFCRVPLAGVWHHPDCPHF